MKKLQIITFIFALALLSTSAVHANDDKYVAAMQKNVQAVYAAKSIDEFQTVTNAFHRIGEAEKSKWEPFYYEAYGYVMMANIEQEPAKKDAHLDLATKALDLAKVIQPNESEIVAMEGFIHMMRVTVDPASRGQQYSGLAFQSFNKAVAMNPENPRALILQAQMEFGTAQFFGSATTEACATAAKALEKFENSKPASVLAPQWGKGMAIGLTTKCK